MSDATTIVVITHDPSPFQVEYFDSISRRTKLHAVYLHASHPTRKFIQPRHETLFLDQINDAEERLIHLIDHAEFVVFSDYQSPMVRRAMGRREAAGQAWSFWGERLGYHGLGWLGRASRYVLMRSLRRSRAPIWAMGSWAVKSYEREFGLERRYFNVPYCSNLRRFSDAGEQRNLSETFRFLYSGSLIHRKGVDLLSHAFRRLATRLQSVSLAVTGRGPLRAEMETILMPVSDRVKFLPDVDWYGLPAQYAQAHVLCAPSRYDGWGMVIPEGLASGLPVISTNRVGAALDLVQPGSNGWIVPADNEEAIYQAMLEAATMDSLKWRGMSQYARTVIEKYDLQAGTDRFLHAVADSLSQC